MKRKKNNHKKIRKEINREESNLSSPEYNKEKIYAVLFVTFCISGIVLTFLAALFINEMFALKIFSICFTSCSIYWILNILKSGEFRLGEGLMFILIKRQENPVLFYFTICCAFGIGLMPLLLLVIL